MALTITDPDTVRLIQNAAERSGETPTELIKRLATSSDISPQQQPSSRHETTEEREARIARARKTLGEIHELVTDEDRAFDYDAWLYDENGLPR